MNIRALLHAMTINHNRRHHQYLINLIVDYVLESAIQSVAPGTRMATGACGIKLRRTAPVPVEHSISVYVVETIKNPN